MSEREYRITWVNNAPGTSTLSTKYVNELDLWTETAGITHDENNTLLSVELVVL